MWSQTTYAKAARVLAREREDGHPCGVDRELFEHRFLRAAAEARDFARGFLCEDLPDAMRFRVHLNSSHDDNAGPEFQLFEEDSSFETSLRTKNMTAEEVVSLLWRDGRVPQWIDVTVVAATPHVTVVEVLACGRFIDDEERLYYVWVADRAPFGVKGPALPADHVEGRRFSIHRHAECWSLDDLTNTSAHAGDVTFLHLCGPAFDDAALKRIGRFPRLESLTLTHVAIEGTGLAGLGGMPRVRWLQLSSLDTRRLTLAELPALGALESITLSSLPATLDGAATLASAAPRLSELALASTTTPASDSRLECMGLRSLRLELPSFPAWLAVASSLRALSFTGKSATDGDAGAALACCPPELEDLSLRGSSVTDAVLDAIDRFASLRYLDVAHTAVSPDALTSFLARHPSIKKSWPRLPSSAR